MNPTSNTIDVETTPLLADSTVPSAQSDSFTAAISHAGVNEETCSLSSSTDLVDNGDRAHVSVLQIVLVLLIGKWNGREYASCVSCQDRCFHLQRRWLTPHGNTSHHCIRVRCFARLDLATYQFQSRWRSYATTRELRRNSCCAV
jgi:hypothetical protein